MSTVNQLVISEIPLNRVVNSFDDIASSNINIRVNVSQNQAWLPRDSFFVAKYKVCHVVNAVDKVIPRFRDNLRIEEKDGGGGDTVIDKFERIPSWMDNSDAESKRKSVALNINPVASMFRRFSTKLNGTELYNIERFPQCDTIMKRLHGQFSKEEISFMGRNAEMTIDDSYDAYIPPPGDFVSGLSRYDNHEEGQHSEGYQIITKLYTPSLGVFTMSHLYTGLYEMELQCGDTASSLKSAVMQQLQDKTLHSDVKVELLSLKFYGAFLPTNKTPSPREFINFQIPQWQAQVVNGSDETQINFDVNKFTRSALVYWTRSTSDSGLDCLNPRVSFRVQDEKKKDANNIRPFDASETLVLPKNRLYLQNSSGVQYPRNGLQLDSPHVQERLSELLTHNLIQMKHQGFNGFTVEDMRTFRQQGPFMFTQVDVKDCENRLQVIAALDRKTDDYGNGSEAYKGEVQCVLCSIYDQPYVINYGPNGVQSVQRGNIKESVV